MPAQFLPPRPSKERHVVGGRDRGSRRAGRTTPIFRRFLYPKREKQEGNVLQEPAAAMHQMFPLKRLYNVSTKSVSRKSMFPKLSIMRSISQNVDQTTPNAPLTCS